MRLALCSDVHANLPALEAVLAAIERSDPDLLLCLGDLVGYGPMPGPCVDLAMASGDVVIAGNHDVDVWRDRSLDGTRADARRLLSWTRQRLSVRHLETLSALPWRHQIPGEWVAVHGCYLNPEGLTGYVTSTMLEENLLALCALPDRPPLAFCGHTHVPLCGWLTSDGTVVEQKAAGPVSWPASARTVLVNPGAVGQPRDGDPRAAWALVDTAACAVEFHRVAYDVARVVAALSAEGLSAELGQRLSAGR